MRPGSLVCIILVTHMVVPVRHAACEIIFLLSLPLAWSMSTAATSTCRWTLPSRPTSGSGRSRAPWPRVQPPGRPCAPPPRGGRIGARARAIDMHLFLHRSPPRPVNSGSASASEWRMHNYDARDDDARGPRVPFCETLRY